MKSHGNSIVSQRNTDVSQAFTNIHKWIMCLSVVLLSVVGIILTRSVEVNRTDGYYRDLYYCLQQVLFSVTGFVALILCSFVKPKHMKKAAPVIGGLAVLLLFLLYTPLGITFQGATRWLKIGVISFRPDELAVFAVVLIMAYITAYFHKNGTKYQLLCWTWGVSSVMAMLIGMITNILVYPVLILGITYIITLVFAEMVIFHILALGTGMVSFLCYILLALQSGGPEGFRMTRLRAWLNPGQYADSYGYQALKQLEAIGRGGLFGKGFKQGQLTEAVQGAVFDGYFALFCEEFGWIAALLLVVVIIALLYCIYKILRMAVELRLSFEAALTLGVLAHLGLSSFVYIARNLNILPNGNGFLPFVSYTGFSGIFCFCEIGLVLAVAKKCQKLLNMKNKE